MYKKYLKFIISIIVCQSAGFLGSQFTVSSVRTWYPTLNQPFFNPPNWIFAPVWTLLYLLMGIALYLVWIQERDMKRTRAISIFALQLILNVTWSAVFFARQSILGGFIVIVLLWIAVFVNIKIFGKISLASKYLMIPYIVWLSFALMLNLGYLVLN